LTKCAHCNEEIKIGDYTFIEIPKKRFCQSCWHKIYTLWKAQRLSLQEPSLLDWTHKIKLNE